MRTIRLALILASFAGLVRGASIEIGESREEVMAKVARPSSTAKRANREILSYPNGGRIEFVDGKVESFKPPLPDAPAGTAAYVPPSAPAVAVEKATAPAPTAKQAKSPAPVAQQGKAPAPAATAAKEEANSREQALKSAGVKFVSGPKTVPLGKTAELKVPAGFSFVGADSLDRFYEVTQNVRSGDEVGVLVAREWMLFFEYNDIGYVKDEDKDKLDADKLMKAMTENEDDENRDRQRRGWDAMKVKGWATKPHYDEKTHNLKWAINLSSSQDNFKDIWINESIRLLGRGGVMNVTLVTDTPTFKAAEVAAENLLAQNYSYVSGQKYSEFKKGDKIAAYGLSALVLGGAGVMAAKAGLFGKLGLLMGKMWKVVVGVLILIGAGFKKILNLITGAREKESPPSA